MSLVWPSSIIFAICGVFLRISTAAVSFPSFVLISFSETIPRSTRASSSTLSGTTSRSIVWAALLVCSVEKTRCPVSAAVSTVDIVSRSRISPTMMTSGSCRIALRSASRKLGVSVPISRCEIAATLSMKRNSIGSSIVTMCSGSFSAIAEIIAARVVDLPDPVGPVTRTRPSGTCVIS